MRKLVVTGASGLIGSTLINSLNKLNVDVVAVDIRSAFHGQKNVSILDYNSLKNLIKDCVGVIHLAAISRVVWGEVAPELCRRVNIDGTRNVIKACMESPTKPWLICASSREVYGQQDVLPVNEGGNFRPHNHYAKSKVDAENLVNEANKMGLKTSILRFSNVFGGRHDYSERVVPAFCSNAINNKPLMVNGEDSVLDFTYVEDVVKGIIKAIEFLSSNSESLPAIHFTTGRGTSLFELANLAVSLTNSISDIILKPKNSIYPCHFCGDYSRARSLLGWQPTHYIKEGMAKYIKELTAEVAKVHNLNMAHVNENFESYSRISA